MAASTTQGKGNGASGKPTSTELAILANGPSILYTGIAVSSDEEVISSPPSVSNTVTFPNPLPGGGENYVVMLTTISGGNGYVVEKNENDNGDFIGFTFATEAECDVMYLVTKVGIKPTTR